MASARKSDVESLDAIIRASYEVMGGKAGEPRDWERFRSLFVEGARMMPVISRPEPMVRVLSPEEFIGRVTPILATEHFFERELGRQTETIGRMAHVLSQYESLRDPAGPAFEQGTNSMQLFNDGERWWIVSIMWNTAREK